jgi:non-specific serine/threonine protein kinase
MQIFVSYRRQDSSAYAGRLVDDLGERFGEKHVFVDVDGIDAGADFHDVIVDTIERADVLVAVVGRQWLLAANERGGRRLDEPDDFVRMELELALEQGVRVIPVLVQGASMPAAEHLPAAIARFARRQAVELSDRRWRSDVGELVAALEEFATAKGLETGSTRPPAPAPGGPDPLPATGPVGRPGRRSRPLPRHRTRFVGRDDDVEQVCRLLTSTGFVTVTGPGGVGKTRLAIEAARSVESHYEDGACLAELASLDDPALVVQTVTRAAGVESAGETTLDTLLDGLADRGLLLIVDNCEHLIEEAAIVVEAIIQRCPAVHVLATSREALSVDGEAVCRLAPLATPDTGGAVTGAAIGQFAAAALFADRAELAAPSFRLDDRTAAAVARIVATLDGLPLALELAAASLRSLELDEVTEGLADRFNPASGRRTAQSRQKTLWSTVDWSYDLLDEPDRLILERLGVFAGTFAADAADRVCGSGLAPGDVASALVRLVERSLVQPAEEPGEGNSASRFRLLYAVRDYARTRLRSRNGDPTTARLQEWAAEIAGVHGRAVDIGDELAALGVLDAEHPNLVAALNTALEEGKGPVVCQIASSLAPYWDMRGLREEGSRWVEQACGLSPDGDDLVRGRCLMAAYRLAGSADFDTRRRLANEALAAADRSGDDVVAGAALASLGHIELEIHQPERARHHLEAAMERAGASGDDVGMAVVLERLAMCLALEGDLHSQQELLAQASALFRDAGNRRGQLWCLAELGMADITSGDVAGAVAAYREGLRLARELGYLHGEAWMLDALGETAVAGGDFEGGRLRFGEANAIQQRLNDQLNRGWSLGGLVRTHLRTGDLAGAVRWLEESLRYLRHDVGAPSYPFAFLLRTGCVAVAGGHPEQAARILGALDLMDPPADLSAIDRADHRAIEVDAGVALGPDGLAQARLAGRAIAPLDLMQQVLELLA